MKRNSRKVVPPGEASVTRPPLADLDHSGPDNPPPVRLPGAVPIIVTATMGAADQRWFDALRATHFPPERSHVAAHITLFHQLPPASLAELAGLIRRIAADTPPPEARVSEVYSLGTGIAFRIASPDLLAIRARIADQLHGLLGAQDRGTPRLHITVQNKAAPAETRALLADLSRHFRPRPLLIAGLAAWHYRGGPWDPAFARNFRGPVGRRY